MGRANHLASPAVSIRHSHRRGRACPVPCRETGGQRATTTRATTRVAPSVPGMGMDLQPERRLPERATTTVVKPKVGRATAVLEEGWIEGTTVRTGTDSEAECER